MIMRNSLKVVDVVDDESGWVPQRLPGGIYCSPRCGGGCTKAKYDRATKDAAVLCARLGDGWHPRVWENLGWHWEVTKGTVSDDRFDGTGVIVRHDSGKYNVEFRSANILSPDGRCETVTQFYASADTPEEAIGLVRQDVRTFVSRVQDDLADTI
jgi:hypothetical protein